MQRYFIEKIDPSLEHITLPKQESHHVKNVMRMKKNDQIIVCDDTGVCFLCGITSFDNSLVHLQVIEKMVSQDKGFHVTIGQALIRRERFELFLQKASELGVDDIIPIEMKNSIISIKDDKRSNKIERWNQITKEASEQSHRFNKAVVKDIVKLKSINFSDYDIVFVAYEKETENNSLKMILRKRYNKVLLLVGPEGGFDSSEIRYLQDFKNVVFIGLGQRILRSETAGLYFLSVLHYEYEMGDE